MVDRVASLSLLFVAVCSVVSGEPLVDALESSSVQEEGCQWFHFSGVANAMDVQPRAGSEGQWHNKTSAWFRQQTTSCDAENCLLEHNPITIKSRDTHPSEQFCCTLT